jgi:hypothetical protein
MPSDRPLNYNDTMSPELIARAAAEADRRGRFWVHVDAAADRSAREWSRYEGRGGPWTNRDVASTAFDPVFRVVLDAMRDCRVWGVTQKLMAEEPGAPNAWLARYTTRSGRSLAVDVAAQGADVDLEAWWWLAQHADLAISCDAARLDAPTLFTAVSGIVFAGTGRVIPDAVMSHARARAREPGTVALVPRARGTGWTMVVVAAPGLAGELGQEVLRRCQPSAEVMRASERLDVAILGTSQAGNYWTDSVVAHDLEKYIASALRRGEKCPEIPFDAIRALAAAEGVAIAEGRAAPTGGGMAEHTTGIVVERVTKADPMSEATIELALRVVQRIADDGTYVQKHWVSDEGRRRFRAEVDGLHKRLVAALAARRARASAPNAVPLPPLRKVHGRPTNWRTKWLHLMLDDAIALIGAIRDETGAIPLVLMKDLTFHELTTDWEAREMISTVRGCPFEEREGDWPGVGWPELQHGQRVLFWWADVSSRPVARETEDSWEIESWGHAELLLRGATPRRVIRSEWSYPTGTELRQEKFAGPGPWQDVDWKLLRRKVKQVGALVTGALGGVAPVDLRDFWTLPVAAASARAGARILMGDYFSSAAKLPK